MNDFSLGADDDFFSDCETSTTVHQNCHSHAELLPPKRPYFTTEGGGTKNREQGSTLYLGLRLTNHADETIFDD